MQAQSDSTAAWFYILQRDFKFYSVSTMCYWISSICNSDWERHSAWHSPIAHVLFWCFYWSSNDEVTQTNYLGHAQPCLMFCSSSLHAVNSNSSLPLSRECRAVEWLFVAIGDPKWGPFYFLYFSFTTSEVLTSRRKNPNSLENSFTS